MLAATLLGGVGNAWAIDLNIAQGSFETMAGDRFHEHITIAGEIRVTPSDGLDANKGWLRLRSQRIEITSTGLINANGRGWPSSDEGGSGYESGAGQTLTSAVGLAPGGGGAHYGLGGRGTIPNAPCAPFNPAVLGGLAYDTEPDDPLGLSSIQAARLGGMGSAGGAGQAIGGVTIGSGGNGGGLIILEAAEIVIDGILAANGVTPQLTTEGAGTGGVPAGGGAGGTVIVISNAFSMGDDAQCLARGGAGALNLLPGADAAAQGGGGGGGRIVLMVGAAHQDAHFHKLDVQGGEDDEHDPCPNGPSDGPHGGDGLAQIIDAPACADADLDGFGAEPCGQDCDDTDGSIHPGAHESCDGVDENCDGEIDEQLWADQDAGTPDGGTLVTVEPVCAQGWDYECIDAQCRLFVTGEQDPTGKLRLGGGLCSARPGALASGGAAGLLLGLLLALGLRRRRGTESPEQRPR